MLLDAIGWDRALFWAGWLVAFGAGAHLVFQEMSPALRRVSRAMAASQAWSPAGPHPGGAGGAMMRRRRAQRRWLVAIGTTATLSWGLLLWLTGPLVGLSG